MAFTEGTRILTSNGWKNIEDISGRDRVLVRNFIGDAEFIQPFALKKRHYEGEVVFFGGTYWGVTVTPEHEIVYDREASGIGRNEQKTTADMVKVDKHFHLHRQFRYIHEDKTSETIMLYGKTARRVQISDREWYTILAYTLTQGYINKDRNPRVLYYLQEHEIPPLVSIFDMYGIGWTLTTIGRQLVVIVRRDNNLGRKLKHVLGARARRDMKLPDKIVYGSSPAQAKFFVDQVMSLIGKKSKKRLNQILFSTASDNFIEALRMMCLFCGYSFSETVVADGTHIAYIIPKQVSPWSVRAVERKNYIGPVYEIDLFAGQVYVTERSLPVWMSPK